MVDVVIPVYNRQTLASQALASVLKQTYSQIKIFVVDDASTRDFFLPQSCPHVSLVRCEKNQGAAAARNWGASLGNAPYIAFLDSDDLWHEQKLEAQISFMQRNPHVQWIHTNEEWIKNSCVVSQHKKHQKQGGFFLPRLFQLCLISPSSVLFRRDFFMRHGGFATAFRVAEDYEFWLRLNFKHEIAFLDFPYTIKRAGAWAQLSSQIEIDRFRVLALHRFYRLHGHEQEFTCYFNFWLTEIQRKLDILLKGAKKYSRHHRVQEYNRWKLVVERIAKHF